MKKVRLIDVDKTNLDAVLRLSVADDQKRYVATNAVSVAQSKFYPTLRTEAVYNECEPVGFVMYGFDPDDQRFSLVRLMIDEKFQGNGFGRMATEAVIDELRQVEDCTEVFLSFVQGNNPAEKLYETVGFEKTGEIDEASGEIVMKYVFE